MVHEVVFCLSWILIAGMLLLAGHHKEEGIRWLWMLMGYSALIVVLLAPMAAVAETFEYEVLKVLNSLSTWNASQKYFSIPLLSHVKSLDWGFRIGGIVIGQRVLSQVSVALLISLLVS